MKALSVISFAVIGVTCFGGGPHSGGRPGNNGSSREGRTIGAPDPSSYGILADKSPKKVNSPSIPDNKTRDLAKWYNRNKIDLNSASWKNPMIVTDDRVSEIKTEFAKAVGLNTDTIGRDLRITCMRDGRIKLDFQNTGEVFYYNPPKGKQPSNTDDAR